MEQWGNFSCDWLHCQTIYMKQQYSFWDDESNVRLGTRNRIEILVSIPLDTQWYCSWILTRFKASTGSLLHNQNPAGYEYFPSRQSFQDLPFSKYWQLVEDVMKQSVCSATTFCLPDPSSGHLQFMGIVYFSHSSTVYKHKSLVPSFTAKLLDQSRITIVRITTYK